MNETIQLPRRFTFDHHRQFRQAYYGSPRRPRYTVDFSHTEFVDTAALGMLLQLREYAGDRVEAVILCNLLGQAREMVEAAGFPSQFQVVR